MLIDTHTHFYDEWLRPDAEAAIQRALDAGVGKMIQADVDSRERPAMWEIGNRHPGVIYEMLGLYPGSVAADWREELDAVYAIADGQARRSVPAEGVSLPLDCDDEQRHTSPGAAGVYEGAEPPVLMYGWGDSNSHAFRHQILSLGCLPIPTHPHGTAKIGYFPVFC